jgi:hypothetical protein
MNEASFIVKLFIFPVQLLLFASVACIFLGFRPRPKLAFALGGAGIALSLLRGVILFINGWMPGIDYRGFWEAGMMSRQGIDPYTAQAQFSTPFLYNDRKRG